MTFTPFSLGNMRTIFTDFLLQCKYPSPLKFQKFPISKTEQIEISKDENKTKAQLLVLIDENISTLPSDKIENYESERKLFKNAKKSSLLDFLNNIRSEVLDCSVSFEENC